MPWAKHGRAKAAPRHLRHPSPSSHLPFFTERKGKVVIIISSWIILVLYFLFITYLISIVGVGTTYTTGGVEGKAGWNQMSSGMLYSEPRIVTLMVPNRHTIACSLPGREKRSGKGMGKVKDEKDNRVNRNHLRTKQTTLTRKVAAYSIE